MYIIDLLLDESGAVTREGLLNVAGFILALCVALILHEVAHGLVAYWFGDNTAKLSGRLTLNPAKHFNLVGFVLLLLVGFGFANPVPVNVNNFKNKKAGMISVSLAGVCLNLVLAFIFALLNLIVVKNNFQLSNYDPNNYLAYFFNVFTFLAMVLNINFALFNILPLFPLDGYRLLSCFIPQENPTMTFLRRYSLYIILALILMNSILPQISPLYWYIGKFGEVIRNAFLSFWGAIIN